MKFELTDFDVFQDYNEDCKILKTAFPLCSLNNWSHEYNIGYTQGILPDNIPFAAEVWKYEDEETVVVYIPDVGMINRDEYIKKIVQPKTDEETGLEDARQVEYYDLSSLNGYMTCKYIEGIFEVNAFFTEYLDYVGIIEFISNTRNGYVTYYEDMNGLDVVAISVVIRTGEDKIAKCLLPLIPFEQEETSDASESFLGMEEETGEVYMECCVYIQQEKKFIMELGTGMDSVICFSEMADKGIPGNINVEKGWYCNRDVTIKGNALLEFIKDEYPEKYSEAQTLIDKEVIYLIVADDFS